MNKYYRNIIAIIFILLTSLLLFSFWLDLSFGYGHIILFLAAGYGIFLNVKAQLQYREIKK